MIQIVSQDNESKIQLELSNEVLAAVVLSSLGKKEKLYYEKNHNFVLSLTDVKQFYYLLNQKINNDSNREAQYFEVFIFYDDDSTRQFNSFEKLESYYEREDISPVQITMHWNIIVNFASSETIETQKIELAYLATTDVGFDNGHVQLTIEHTNGIWANEVHNLLRSQIKKTYTTTDKDLSKPFRIKNTLRDVGALASVIVFFLMLLSIGPYNSFFLKSPSYSEELSNSDIDFFGENDLKNSILSSKIPVNQKLLSINIINDYNGAEMGVFLDKIPLNKAIRKDIKHHLDGHSKVVELFDELDRKYSERNKFYEKALMLVIFGTLTIWLVFVFLHFYANYYKNHFSTRSFITLTDASLRSYKKFNESKNKAVFNGISAAAFAVVTGLITSGVWAIFTY